MESMTRFALFIVAAWGLAGCGGGGGGSGSPSGPPSNNNGYTPGVFAPSSTFASQCARPRSGTSDRSGTVFTENMFLRSWTNELYLWYSEVPDANPNSYATDDYFDVLKTTRTTPSGQPKDRFHFVYSTEEWERLSQSGIDVGYGSQWLVLQSRPPRKVVVAYVEPGTPADTMNLPRGAEVLTVDGVDVVNAGTESATRQINAAFFPESTGETHTFRIRETSGAERTFFMVSQAITHTPVLIATTIPQADGPVGYMLFNDHIATAEGQLITAVNALRTAGIRDLILDLRYNGGGYLDIANELSYMIANTTLTNGRPFERLVFNDKHPSTNPVTGRPLGPIPFHSTSVGIDDNVAAGTPLPRLNLDRLYVITGNNTCSASESIINSLRGVNLPIFQIGSTTCGKPYGFYPQDNCGTTYFSIQFEGRNAADFGTYPDGFTPENSSDAASVELAGCAVADDLNTELGDPAEARLAAALAFRASNNNRASCPAASGFAPGPGVSSKQAPPSGEGLMPKSPARENRILR